MWLVEKEAHGTSNISQRVAILIKTRVGTKGERDKNESLNVGRGFMDKRLENGLIKVDLMPIAFGED